MSIINHEIDLGEAWDIVLDQLDEASEDPRHSFRYLTLATVGKDDIPHQRMVVLREFTDEQILTVFTDARSKKVKEIDANNSVSLHFYNYKDKLQLILNGEAELIRSGEEKEEYWEKQGAKSPHSYTSVKSPGTIIDRPDEAYNWNPENPENFCMIRVRVDHMEFLQLSGKKHLRAIRELEDGIWTPSWIVP